MKKLDNRGLSLVELILAIAMSTIVVGAAAMFLYNAERSYRTAEYSVDLQMEAQLLMEQMGNWVMESNHILIGGAADSNILILYKIPRGDKLLSSTSTELGERRIIYLSGKKLYIRIDTEENPGDYYAEIHGSGPDLSSLAADEEYCIGQYVETFTVTLPAGEEEPYIHAIDVQLGMHEGFSRQAQKYIVNNTFSKRNGDLDSDE